MSRILDVWPVGTVALPHYHEVAIRRELQACRHRPTPCRASCGWQDGKRGLGSGLNAPAPSPLPWQLKGQALHDWQPSYRNHGDVRRINPISQHLRLDEQPDRRPGRAMDRKAFLRDKPKILNGGKKCRSMN